MVGKIDLPNKQSVCKPRRRFATIFSQKLVGRHVSVQNTIETVSPK
jgi:hypothetical protein